MTNCDCYDECNNPEHEAETVYFQEGFCEHCDSEIFDLDEAEDMFCCSKRMWEVYEAQEYLDGEEKDN